VEGIDDVLKRLRCIALLPRAIPVIVVHPKIGVETVEEPTRYKGGACALWCVHRPDVAEECLKSRKNLLPIGLLASHYIAVRHEEFNKRWRNPKGLKNDIEETRIAQIGEAYVVGHCLQQ